jgi:FkbM family methyltransferase
MNSGVKEKIRQMMPRGLRPHRILGGPLRGSRIVTSWHDYPGAILGWTETPLLEWFGKNVKTGETWLDIGAHYGYTALALSKLVGDRGRVFAFEPMLNTAGSISRTSALNHLTQLTVVPMALSNCEDLETDSLQVLRGMLGQVFVNETPASTSGSGTHETPGSKYSFLSCRLEWLWPRISGSNAHVDGVKIDVQGMEIQVLKGMLPLLKANRPQLLVEVHYGVSRPELLEVITSAGYVGRGIPVEPIPCETEPQYIDDKTYAFTPDPSRPVIV